MDRACARRMYSLFENEQSTFRPGVLDGGAEQRVNEVFQDDFAGHRLRDLEDRCELQVFDRRADRAARVGRRLFLAEVWIELVELPHFAVGSPAQVALAGVSQVKLCDLLETARPVEAPGHLVGDRLVVDEAVCSGRADGLLVKMLGIKYAALDTCDLCADKRSAVFEILRAIHGPDLELPVVSGQSLQMLLPLLKRCGVVECRPGKRSVEVMVRRFQS